MSGLDLLIIGHPDDFEIIHQNIPFCDDATCFQCLVSPCGNCHE